MPISSNASADRPDVSVIVPIYNVESFLAACIESIQSQTHTNIEIILIDDGSSDRSGSICDKYAEHDPRIRVIHQKNGGVCKARNSGLTVARGEYLILVDSDDVIAPDLISNSLCAAHENDLDCFVYSYKMIDEDALAIPDLDRVSDIEVFGRDEALCIIMRGYPFRMLACNKLYKASLWKDIEFPEHRKYGDDTSVTYKVLDKCRRIGYTKNVYYFYRLRNGSALNSKISIANLQLFDAYDEFIEYILLHHSALKDNAYLSYQDRIFDFLSKLKKSTFSKKQELYLIISQMQAHVIKHQSELLRLKSSTPKQRFIIKLLSLKPHYFWIIYRICC